MNSRTSALCAALLLSLPACLSAQEVRVLDGGGLRVEDGGGITAEGEVRVAGADNPTLTLAGGSTLRLAPGTLLSVGDGTDPGTLSASGTPAPAITTSGIPGTDFYSFSVASTGTLAVTALALTSPDMGGITLASGSTLAGGALSGAAFDYVQNGGTYLRFLHTAGSFAVSGCTFNNSGAVALFNISSPLGTVPATLLVNAYTNNGGARAGSPYEDDHGSGTDIAAATSTIRWFDEGTPPTLLTPVSWAALYDNTPDFDWSDVTNAAGYELAVDNNWTFASPEIGVSVVPSAAPDQGPPLAENTYFYWRVRAVDPVGQYG
ncbi:MAG: hypothetical protein HYY17_10310, partial [Planctomycetes bacterium]|nr:hypothetical protein [Planctomycetota bacterium]